VTRLHETKAGKRAERAVAVGLVLPSVPSHIAEEHLDELRKLIETAGGEPVATIVQERQAPDPATWIGKGKAEEVQATVEEKEAGLVVFDDDLSPAQIRNLEKIISAKVVDRSGLILDIFASRARSREARTQVELAQLQYLLPRLTRQWTHLSRQAGGIGTRGVGETQLEIDRRIIRTRISRLRRELERIEKNRETQRLGRAGTFTVALVGYTNAGKSTLFNRLTAGSALAENKLFATLDAKVQKAADPMPRETVVVDTVGFVRKLPHHLVASFRSTMEEAASADLVLHLVDLSHADYLEHLEVGKQVLLDLGIPRDRVFEVFNKIDRFAGPLSRDRDTIAVSAVTGENVDVMLDMIRRREISQGRTLHLRIPIEESRSIARVHELGQVHEQSQADGHYSFLVWLPEEAIYQFSPYLSPEDRDVVDP